jgi:hypothetical protein
MGPLNWRILVSFCGIIFGLFSAFLLARGLLLRSPLDVFGDLEAYGSWDFLVSPGASRLLQGGLSLRLDTLSGSLFLVLSFACQAAAMFLPDTGPPLRSLVTGACVSALVVVPAYIVVPWWTDARARSQALAFYEQYRPKAPPSWQPMIDERLRELRGGK